MGYRHGLETFEFVYSDSSSPYTILDVQLRGLASPQTQLAKYSTCNTAIINLNLIIQPLSLRLAVISSAAETVRWEAREGGGGQRDWR